MFFPGSRYEKTGTFAVKRQDGTTVITTQLPLPAVRSLLGYHRRLLGQRLDHLAAHYLNDANGFWQLCDANDALSPDALAARDLIGIPAKER